MRRLAEQGQLDKDKIHGRKTDVTPNKPQGGSISGLLDKDKGQATDRTKTGSMPGLKR